MLRAASDELRTVMPARLVRGFRMHVETISLLALQRQFRQKAPLAARFSLPRVHSIAGLGLGIHGFRMRCPTAASDCR